MTATARTVRLHGEFHIFFPNPLDTSRTMCIIVVIHIYARLSVTITPRQFEVHPSSGVPIYLQIVEQVNALVAGGHQRPGEMLPSVRQMASELGVNHMTISKAYSRLEADGIVEHVRGKGMELRANSVNASLPDRQAELKPLVIQAVVRARQLGLNNQQILAVLKHVLQEISP